MEEYKKGDKVCCIGGDLNIECVVVDVSQNNIKIFDPVMHKEFWVSRYQISFNKQYYRDKYLTELGI